MAVKSFTSPPLKGLNGLEDSGFGSRDKEGELPFEIKQKRIEALTSDVVEAFATHYLSNRYDEKKPVAPFHRKVWQLYCTSHPGCAVAAPRGHAKSTSFTFVYTLANALFRVEDYIIILGSNEELAIEQLGDITLELSENEELIKDFGVSKFIVLAKTEIIVEFTDGSQFRILARGKGQKIRGRKWRNKRPGLIICDDLEDDEEVESAERRLKFRRWFYRAVKPALSRTGRLRYHGTIIANKDTLLARTMRNKKWNTLFFKAHKSFDDFSEVLWPEQYSEGRLREIRDGYIAEGDASGYSNEYLNSPINEGTRFLQPEWFLPMTQEILESRKQYIIGVDLAISTADTANRTAMVVCGKDLENRLSFVDVAVDRWDTTGIFDKLFDLQAKWEPSAFYIEDGHILKTFLPLLYKEMRERDSFLKVVPISNAKDKKVKGRSLQKKMRAGACFFHKEEDWYGGFEGECLEFTGITEAVLDDQYDAAAICARAFDLIPEIELEDVLGEEDREALWLEKTYRKELRAKSAGRNKVTGY